jgi:TRAP-type mannitol/chloroaromatic compound transport system permease large subunit
MMSFEMMAPVMFGALVLFLLVGYPVAFPSVPWACCSA